MRGLLVAEGPLRVPSRRALREGQDRPFESPQDRLWQAQGERNRELTLRGMSECGVSRLWPAVRLFLQWTYSWLGAFQLQIQDSFCRGTTTPPLSGAKPVRSSRRTARARGAVARKWRRCAVPDPCMRVPWEEGSRGVGVGARGSCQGGSPSTGSGRTDLGGARPVGSGGCDGGRRRLAPALGSRESGNDDGGCGGMRWREGLVSGWGPLSRAGGSRTAPTTGVGRTRAGVMRGLVVVEGPSTGSGRTDLGGALAVGGGGCDGGRRRPTPRTCPGFPRERERRWGVWWDALAPGVGVRVGARSRGRAVREPPLRPGWGARGRG